MDVSVVIVSWNVKPLLEKCLRSLRNSNSSTPQEIIVVDNASTDGTQEMVTRQFPEVKLLSEGVNTGFAAANNHGARVSQGRFLFFLNPDTEVSSETIPALINSLEKHRYAAIVGPRLLNSDGTLQPSVRSFPSASTLLIYALKLHRLLPRLPVLRRYLQERFDWAKSQPVDQVMGAALMMRKDIFEKLGGFDESFFIWFEEVDLCKRIQENGMEIWYMPEASVVHHGGQSFRQQGTIYKQRLFLASARRYAKKHLGTPSWGVLSLLTPLSLLLGYVQQKLSPRR